MRKWGGVGLAARVSNLALTSLILLCLLSMYLFAQVALFPNVSYTGVKTTAHLTGALYKVHDSDVRAKIVVAELNDGYLQDLNTPWPPTYGAYRLMLEDVARFKPASIFLDIALRFKRADPGLKDLVATLCALHGQPTRIYLAGLEDEHGALRYVPELEEKAGQCFEPVGIRYDPDPLTKMATAYPLVGNGAPPSNATDDGLQVRQRISSAAHAIASQVLGHDIEVPADAHNNQMAVIWGLAPHQQEPWGQWDYCRKDFVPLLEVIPAGIRQAWQSEAAFQPVCPYHQHVPLRLISNPESEQAHAWLHSKLQGSHVLIGAAASGVNDVVFTPVHGMVPGVYLHAMALDNLLTYGAAYKHNESLFKNHLGLFLAFALLIGTLNFLIHGRIKAMVDRYIAPPLPPGPLRGNLLQRARVQLRQGWGWALLMGSEVVISLFLSLVGFYFLERNSTSSMQDFAKVIALSLTLQWTGLTGKFVDGVMKVIRPAR